MHEGVSNRYWVSIPYSTIKIGTALVQVECRLKFQFLIVRLKFSGGVITFTCNMWFQFLIVRLKLKRISSPISIDFVSIPYSTIKISSLLPAPPSEPVSIPYSTIKIPHTPLPVVLSFSVSIPYSTIKILQNHKNNLHIHSVSIPYSTIKISPRLPRRAEEAVSIPYSTIKMRFATRAGSSKI